MGVSRAAHARNLIGPLVRSTYSIEVTGADALPKRGPVLIACDWNNIAAPTVVKSGLPRPVHVWASGPAALPGPLLSVSGDLAMPENKAGIGVVREVVDLLVQGEAVVAIGVRDLGYVLARSWAPLMTAGINAPDTKRPTDPPARKSNISVTMGPVHELPERLRIEHPTRSSVRAAGEWARQIVVDGTGVR